MADSIFNWSPEFSVGHQVLDDQHKKLFDLCKETERLLTDDNTYTSKAFHCILDEISEQARLHFHTEEKILDECNYPDYRDHRDEHYDFLSKLADMYLDSTEKKIDKEGVINFLHLWFVDHILTQDMKYKPYVNKELPAKG